MTVSLNCSVCGVACNGRRGLSTHTRVKHPESYRPRPKYVSRAARLDAAVATWGAAQSAAEALRDAAQTWLDATDEDDAAATFEVSKSDADLLLDGDLSTFEELRDEMDSWRDNMEEKLGHTQKFEEVSEAADGMSTVVDAAEEAQSAIQDASTEVAQATINREAVEALVEALDRVVESCETIDSEASSVSFPGMY